LEMEELPLKQTENENDVK